MESTKTKSLKEHYELTKENDPLILAKISGRDVSYVKSFLKKAQGLSYTTGHKINKKLYVPCGSNQAGHYQADCLFMTDYKSTNKQFTGILTCLNTTSRQAYARPFKNTTAKTISQLMREIIEDQKKAGDVDIEILRTDIGPEFVNEVFNEMIEDLRIIHETAEANTSAWLNRTNRFHRTLRGLFRDLFARNKNNKWVEHLPKIISDYNQTPSRAFANSLHKKKPPNEINKTDIQAINEFEQETAAKVGKHDDNAFNIGDFVRLRSQFTKKNKKDKFLKSSMDNVFTPEIYKIIGRNGPNTWKIDAKNEITIWQTYNLMKSNETEYNKQEVNNFVDVKAARKERAFLLEIPKEERPKKIGNLNIRTTRQSKMTTRAKNKPIEPEFEVSELLESKIIRKKQFILVKWKGYNAEHNTWEPRESLYNDVPEMVLNFEKGKF